MSNEQPTRKESEIQATSDPPPAEIPSPIAPQGYEEEFVEDIAQMETAGQKRGKALRYLIFMVLGFFLIVYFCVPRNSTDLPSNVEIPYNLQDRPLPPTDLFLHQIPPKTLGDYTIVHRKVERSFEKPFVGAEIAQFTYVNPQGQTATLNIINAESYINAKRYLSSLKIILNEEVDATEVVDFIWQEHNFLQWEVPDWAERRYGFAWSNQHFYYSVYSGNEDTRDFIVENFPY